MNEALQAMFERYSPVSAEDYENAFKEIIQEIALLGLWRTKFFERAAFYGGTALRILYGLDRFSEDMDFSLLRRDKGFDLQPYCAGITDELEGFGLSVTVEKKEKAAETTIESAFIKTGTLKNLISIDAPTRISKKIPSNRLIKIKVEVDIDPPLGFETEAKYLLQPIPFSVNAYTPSDLFAGKMHALLCRQWKTRVKGRDWYDFVWYVARGIPLHLNHLETRMKQSGHFQKNQRLTQEKLIELLKDKVSKLDVNAAKKDVLPMLKDPATIEVWSKEFFGELINRIPYT
jgi:predicted nucleotidyltransferase component of viral defense system